MWFPSIRALCSLSAAFLFFLLTWSSTPAYSASSSKDGINDGPYKVLIALPLGSKSHKNIFWPLAMGLAGRGHQVTLISAHKPYKQVKGITEITLDGLYAPLDKAAQGMWTMEKERFGKAKLIKGVMDAAVDTCNKTLSHWALKPIFEGARSGTSHFDVVIASAFFNECSFPFAQIYQAPLVLVSIVGLLPWLSQSSGFRDITSFMTSPMSAEASDKLTFMSRMVTTIEYMASPLALRFYYWPQIDALVEAKFANDIASGKYKLLPPMSEKEWGRRKAMLTSEAMLGSTSMVFINTHVASEGVRPLLPSVVEVGGMHCVPANPLPKDLEKWVSSNEDGFVLFSLGSVVTPDKLSDAHRQAFIDAFKQFPRLNFLWKWSSDSMDGLPPNVKVSTWLPQQDLLGHRKIKAFITHGGLLSTQEAIYHGVPVIGIPVGADQQNNMQRAVNQGVGLRLSWDALSTDAIVNALKTVIMEPRFKENLLTRAAVFKDQPESPLQRAVFWTEYVVRHHGAPHLSSGSKDLYWWQFYLLDVWATILAAIFVPIWISMKITSAIFGMLFPGDKTESPKASGQSGKSAKKDSGAKKPKKSTKQE